MTYDLVIIGGGPTGASAAVFAARARFRTLVIDTDGKGMAERALIPNHLGFPGGIDGPELIDLGRRHARKSGAEWVEDQVTSLSVDGDVVTLATAGGQTFEARDVLLAQGTNTTLATDAGIEVTDGTEPWISTIVTVDSAGRTSAPHVWAAGTIAGTSVHTIVVAGDGARVAINVISARRGKRHVDHEALEISLDD